MIQVDDRFLEGFTPMNDRVESNVLESDIVLRLPLTHPPVGSRSRFGGTYTKHVGGQLLTAAFIVHFVISHRQVPALFTT